MAEAQKTETRFTGEAKPEALALAELFESEDGFDELDKIIDAAALLRNQHAEIESLRVQVEALRVDGERLLFACEFDGYEYVPKDKYDYACDCANEAGRDLPTEEDELNGLRRLIDAAREKAHG